MEAITELLKGKVESSVRKVAAPQGWTYAAIGELCTLINGRAFKPSDWTNTGLPIIRIQNLNNPDAKFNHFLGNVEPKFIVDNGELLFAWSGTPGTSFGAHIWTGERAVLNQHIFRVLFDETVIDKNFFKIAINQKLQELIDKAHGGVGLRHVTKGKFEQTEILLPSFNEQRGIVAKIEALKARSQRVKEELEAIAPLLDQFRQSVLVAAFRGDLTADWREKNPDVEPASELLKQIQEERKTQYEQACIRAKAEGIRKPNPIQDISISLENEEFQSLPNSWVWASLESISNFCRPITYGVIKLGDEVENGVPCLRTSDVKPLSIKLENVKKISRAIANNYSRTYLQGGELLVNVRGTLGGVAVVPEHLAGYNISREVAMVPILSNIPVKWTAYWVASVTAQTWLTNVSKGVAYTGINLEDLRQLPVPIPPVAEIKVAVETIEKLYFISSQIEQQYNEAKAHLDKLDQSILAKAFRGELVPQDPNDEPASVLLERIRAEREKLDTKKKAKGKTEKKSRKTKSEAAEPEQLSLPGFE